MNFSTRISRDWRFVRGLFRTLFWVAPIKPHSPVLTCDDIEAAVDKYGPRRAITFEGATLSFDQFDARANRYAHWALGQGLDRNATVALFMPNRPDYLAAWYGLSKVGVAAALVNTNLTGAQLAHCLSISGADHVLLDGETAPAFEALRTTLAKPVTAWTLDHVTAQERDLEAALSDCADTRPDKAIRKGLDTNDLSLYIFTSGTTGLPKAARMTHMRTKLYMRGFAGSTGAKKDDRIYIVLPLYHATGGLCAVGAALLTGGSIVLKRKFSASQFWDDIVAEDCTMFVYIGELCRYLVNQPKRPNERRHKLRLAFGNGLRPDVWQTMLDRFEIPRVLEFYGATEGNVSMFNYDGKVGSIGRVPGWLKKRFNFTLVRFDVEAEAPVRGPDGCCIPCAPGEAGECLGAIGEDVRSAYSGYADKEASEKKVMRDVFAKGDAWFRTGDLMREDEEGYFYFVDRIGDTFRWKGENVSTNEVAEHLSGARGVKEAIVYGVRVGDMDGRAGMASLVAGPEFDVAKLAAFVDAALPAYSRPLFVRLRPEVETTGTFKYRKLDLVEEGFDPGKVREPLYFKDPERGYVEITPDLYRKIVAGDYRL